MTPETFDRFYTDASLRGFVSDMAKRLSPSREAAEDAEQECWLAIAQAPDGVHVDGLRAAIVTSVASAVWQERKPRRAAKMWIRVLKENIL